MNLKRIKLKKILRRLPHETTLKEVETKVHELEDRIDDPPSLKVEILGATVKTIKGKDGKNGRDGRDGKNGLKGDRGERGEKGKDGKEGLMGPRGLKGDKGDPGEQGAKGDKGDRGERGKDGLKGERGAAGKDGVSMDEKRIRLEMLNRLANHGGGNANRRIRIANVDMSNKYTDINWKAGTNVTISYADNDTTKQVDITVAATGGAGTNRSVNSIAVDTTAAGAASTDYVYLISGTTTLTLPTAVGNSDLYTVKNVGTGVVTIATTSSQTIDGTTTITLPVQYTAVDLISDTANWGIT